jgi:hypothetical protein
MRAGCYANFLGMLGLDFDRIRPDSRENGNPPSKHRHCGKVLLDNPSAEW